MPTPVICPSCSDGYFEPAPPPETYVYSCQRCPHEAPAHDFTAAPGERLTLHDGIVQREPLAELPGHQILSPTHRVQAPFVRASLTRQLRLSPEELLLAEDVDNARRLSHDVCLPDCGPWALTPAELRTLHLVLSLRCMPRPRRSGPPPDPRHTAVIRMIAAAHTAAGG